jgi:predicted dehydrogenase
MELLCQHAQPLRRQRCRRRASDYERLLPTAYFYQSPAREALRVEAEHFVNCIEQNNEPLTSGCVGPRVVRILEAATHSKAQRGRPVELYWEGE